MADNKKRNPNRKSRTTRLEPGQNSIERVTPWRQGGTWFIDWSLALLDGRLVRKRSQGSSAQQARERAQRKAAELLATGTGATWKPGAQLTEFIDKESFKALDAAQLRDRSRSKYRTLLTLLTGECGRKNCKHTQSLKGHTIATGTKFRVLEACLTEIKEKHGYENARQARVVLGRFVFQPLKRDGLVERNPLLGEKLDLKPHADDVDDSKRRGGKALSLDDYNKVLNYLLDLDPAEGAEKPRRGRWTLEDVIAARRNLIDLALLQATTGLRVNEACSVIGRLFRVDDAGQMHVAVTKQISKTKIAREVPILMDSDKRVQQRILERLNRAASVDEYLIGSPSDPAKKWDYSNRNKRVAAFYQEISAVLGIELMESERTHMWRATLNTILTPYVPKEIRAAYFGHDQDTNARHYTAGVDTSQMVEAGRQLRGA